MFVVKRDGRREKVAFDKITARISKLCYGLDTNYVDACEIAQKVVSGIYQGVTTVELDNLAAETAAYLTTKHPDYALLAARIAVSNLHKETTKVFSAVIEQLYNYVNPKNGKHSPMVSQATYDIIMKNADRLNSVIIYDRDFNYNYFGFKTLERSYLLKIGGRPAERPQHMLMRVSVGIHGEDIDAAIETYNLLSEKFFTHASPTLFNAGTPRPQLSSCFLLTMKDDSIEGIYDTLKQCAMISKTAGGIGLNVHCIRAAGSYIAGTNGYSNGLIPMLRVYNNTARYVDQGGNKRPGAFAIYLEPWHADVFDFLDLRKNSGKEEVRARDLFYALWIPDLFMKRVEQDGDWSLFCPAEAPGLADVWGDEFEKLYVDYERQGRARRTVKAQKLWSAIVDSQIETGTPFMVYKDACNRKSNQQNLGTIKCSNLCTEIVEYSSPDEVAVCNLASIALPAFVDKENFDFKHLHKVTKVVTRNLNKIIDINYYPVKEAERSNLRHRPIGIGVQGLADAFMLMKLPFDSLKAKELNKNIFETIYHAALEASCELAEKQGPYETYKGSPVSKGILQYDMWGVTPSNLWDWKSLKERISQFGVRNSLLLAPMPTASTSQILGNNECFEPYTSNIYTRRVLAGEFQIVNPHLLKELTERNLWNDSVKNMIIAHGGSIQKIPSIPDDLKSIYKTVWEISQKAVIDMAADRGAFIDQSQSLNIHLAEANFQKITSMHFYGWKKGLKTGMYYLRSRPAVDAIQFTVDQLKLKSDLENTEDEKPMGFASKAEYEAAKLACSIENKGTNNPPYSSRCLHDVLRKGSNSFGQCGTNDTVDYTRFKKVLTINEKILKISHGGYHTFLITESKSVYGCGGNDKGQLGITGLKENLLQFTLLENVKADDIACGWDHSILLLDGRVFVTGSNSFHQLGVEKVKRLDTWTDLSIPESISKISCGLRHSMALTTEGSVYVWGNNSHYKCFTWEKHVIVPTKISLDAYLDADEIVVDMALGQHHSCLLTSKMKCLLAGRNKFGECCGLAPNQDVFSCVIPNCLKVFCGWNTTIFYCIDKKVYGTGRNDYFQLAIDEPQQVNQLVPMLEDVDCISVGSEHCLFLREAKAFAFGWNEHGNLGVEHQNRDIFRVVIGNACLVSAGYGNSFVVVLDS